MLTGSSSESAWANFWFLTCCFLKVASYLRSRHEQPGQHPEGEERAGRGRAAALQGRLNPVSFAQTSPRSPRLYVTDSSFGCRRDFAAAWMNLGIVQNSLREFDKAEQSYWNAIRFRKKYPDCYYNLGRLVRDSDFPGAS